MISDKKKRLTENLLLWVWLPLKITKNIIRFNSSLQMNIKNVLYILKSIIPHIFCLLLFVNLCQHSVSL